MIVVTLISPNCARRDVQVVARLSGRRWQAGVQLPCGQVDWYKGLYATKDTALTALGSSLVISHVGGVLTVNSTREKGIN